MASEKEIMQHEREAIEAAKKWLTLNLGIEVEEVKMPHTISGANVDFKGIIIPDGGELSFKVNGKWLTIWISEWGGIKQGVER